LPTFPNPKVRLWRTVFAANIGNNLRFELPFVQRMENICSNMELLNPVE